MTDRSAVMRAVKSRDTSPELVIRHIVRRIRPGYRLHRRDIPGRPDIAYVGRKKAIFINGCFWHGHNCARGARVPKTNREYWIGKIGRNVERDRKSLQLLRQAGWDALVVWECELKDLSAIETRLRSFLT